MKTTLHTGIIVDVPTATGITYVRKAVEHAINDMSLNESIRRGRMIGGLLDRKNEHISQVQNATHVVHGIFISNGELLVDVQILDTPTGKEVQKMLVAGKKVTAKLIIDVPMGVRNVINVPFRIMQVQLEC